MRTRHASSASGPSGSSRATAPAGHVRVLRPRPVGVARPLAFDRGQRPARATSAERLAAAVARLRARRRARGGRSGRGAARSAAAGSARAARSLQRQPCAPEPHGHGFEHATSWNAAGNVSDTGWREMRTTRSSSGWRSASSALGANSPSSSRKSTPRCASVTSPGRARPLPPPTSAAVDAVWCGARNGRRPTRRPPTGSPGGGVDAGDLERLGGGRAAGGSWRGAGRASSCRCPAGRTNSRWWPPAAATSSAWRANGEPAHVGEVDELVVAERRSVDASASARAGPSRARAPRPSGTRGARRGCVPRAPARRATSAASAALAIGHDDALDPGARERVDERERAGHRADRAVEPELAEHARRRRARRPGARRWRRAAPSATASSSPEPDLRTPPGARLTVMRCWGHVEARRQHRGADAFARLAHRGVGEPDDVVRGQPGRDVDLDGDGLTVDADERGTADRGEHGDLPDRGRWGEGRSAATSTVLRGSRRGVTVTRWDPPGWSATAPRPPATRPGAAASTPRRRGAPTNCTPTGSPLLVGAGRHAHRRLPGRVEDAGERAERRRPAPSSPGRVVSAHPSSGTRIGSVGVSSRSWSPKNGATSRPAASSARSAVDHLGARHASRPRS